ncbi:MAG: hypothetical protein ACRDT6_15240 [Micromonosporaceae bacterium]
MKAANIRFVGLDLYVTELKADLRFPLPIKGLKITPDTVPFWLIPNLPVPLRARNGDITLSYGKIDQIQLDPPIGIQVS